MPVSSRYLASSAAITLRLSSRNERASSRSARKPDRTKPPSRRWCGGSSTSARVSRSARSLPHPARRRAMSASASGRPMPPAPSRNRRAHAAAVASPSRTAARSRGPPRCRARREMARAMSGAARSAPRRSMRSVSPSRRKETASRRAAIATGSRRGLDSRAASSRAPGPVAVRSMAKSRLPCRSPESARSSSRLARLAASMTRRLAGPARRGGRRHGILPICVSSTYLSSAPTAASSARENWPKACRSATPSRRLEQALAGEAVEGGARHRRGRRAGDADPFGTPSSASSRSAAITSPGERRTISPGRSAAGTSPTSNSPVEMSSEASAIVAEPAVPAFGHRRAR